MIYVANELSRSISSIDGTRNAVVVSDFDIGFMPSDLNGKRDK